MYLQKLALSDSSRNSLNVNVIKELFYCCDNRMEVAGFDVSMYKTLIEFWSITDTYMNPLFI